MSAAASSETVAARFRREIERAEARGVDRAAMTLRLTLGDADKLKRDRRVALADIAFTEGVMRYLGVTIDQGGVAASSLHCDDPD
jgi:hypothetical protein